MKFLSILFIFLTFQAIASSNISKFTEDFIGLNMEYYKSTRLDYTMSSNIIMSVQYLYTNHNEHKYNYNASKYGACRVGTSEMYHALTIGIKYWI